MSSTFRVPYPPRGADFSQFEMAALQSLLHTDATLSCGEERSAFEREFAAYLGVAPELAVATTSCTVALELATYFVNLRPGDNVIVTPQSYQATLNALLALDVEVRFGDIDPETLCLAPESVESLLDDHTRAVFLTHYGGLMVRMDTLHTLLAGHDIAVVEDCAHAHGSSYQGVMAGAFGNMACYSFQSMKNMSTLGQGGMLILPNPGLAERARSIIAVEPDATFQAKARLGELGPYANGPESVLTHEKNAFVAECLTIARHGTNSTLTEPSAAVGRVQLQRLPEFLAKRKRVAEHLDTLLSEIPGIRPQESSRDFNHSHHLYTCFCEDGVNNQAVAAALVSRGVEVQQRYFPLHLLPEWRRRGGRVGQCPIAERIWFEHQLNLPIHPTISDSQIEYMADVMREVLNHA